MIPHTARLLSTELRQLPAGAKAALVWGKNKCHTQTVKHMCAPACFACYVLLSNRRALATHLKEQSWHDVPWHSGHCRPAQQLVALSSYANTALQQHKHLHAFHQQPYTIAAPMLCLAATTLSTMPAD
jgi:hypothetical protein